MKRNCGRSGLSASAAEGQAPTQEKLQLKKRGRGVLRDTEAGPFAYGYDTELGVAWRMALGGAKQLTTCFQASGGMDEAIAIQNAVGAGLSSSIFTLDMREAETFISGEGSDCGIANVNIGPSGAEIVGA